MSVKDVLEDWLADRNTVNKLITQLDDKTLEDLVRRGQHRTGGDGHAGNKRPGAGGAHRGNEPARPTEAAAVRLGAEAHDDPELDEPDTWEEWERDLVGQALAAAQADTAKMAALARSVRRKVEYVLDAYKKSNIRPAGAGICAACLRDVPGIGSDRLRSGYCDACRKAWARADFPDRLLFEFSRRPEDEQQAS